MNNRHWNIKNHFQTDAKRVLCLCSAGLLRSPTAANVLHQAYGYNTRAAGVDTSYALIPVDDVMLKWADEIVCVHESVYENLLARHPEAAGLNVVVLNVPDQYSWNDSTLRSTILSEYEERTNAARN